MKSIPKVLVALAVYGVSIAGLAVGAALCLGWAYIIWLMIGGPPVV